MKHRTPVPRPQRPPLPAFAPVPRKCARHDGWTPERQKAFIEALADTGSVSRAAAQVNMSSEGAYYLRRQPGADAFRRAWEAALDYGVARMKDIAFERAVEGYLVPMFVGGRLLGWRRKYNDRLLMFCLRHYGEDANGKRTTVNYFSTRATAGAQSPSLSRSDGEGDQPQPKAKAGGGVSAAQASAQASAEASATTETTTVRTIINGPSGQGDAAASLDHTALAIDGFAGIELDDHAAAEIHAVLAACAARRRAVAGTPDDEAEPFIAAEQPLRDMLVYDPGYSRPRKERRRPPPAYDVVAIPEHMVEPTPRLLVQRDEQFRSSDAEMSWEMLDDEAGMTAIEDAVRQIAESKAKDASASLGLGQEPIASGQPARSDRTDDEAGFSPAEPASAPPPQGEGDQSRTSGNGGGGPPVQPLLPSPSTGRSAQAVRGTAEHCRGRVRVTKKKEPKQ